MSNRIKRAVQGILVKRRHGIYKERIARQAVPYGVWIKKMLEEERAEITAWQEKREKSGGERLSVSVFSAEAFCESISGEDAWGERGDIWLVASEPSRLTEKAAQETERYFLEHPACGIAYGDESDYFKPGWSPDLLQSFFYFGNVFALRRTLAEKAAEKVKDRIRLYEEAVPDEAGEDDNARKQLFLRKQLYDIVLCCIDEAKEAGHIEKLLFMAEAAGKTEGAPANEDIPARYRDWGREPAFQVIKKGHLYSDIEIPAEKKDQKLVSVIIPSKDNPAVLSKCIHSLMGQTDYQNMEIIVIDNGSNDKNKNRILQMNNRIVEEYRFRYLYRPMPFNFSAMCNQGAKEAKGEFLLFLNDDMEIVEEDWLRRMLSRAEKSYVGAVGAKLLYPNSEKIQHMGITSIHLGPAHELQYSWDNEEHYHGYNRCAVNVSAVTGACLLMRREVFERTSGFSEKLQVAFNDVELCFQLLRLGYRNVCCNDTFLYHHESLSRGLDATFEKLERLHRERDILYAAYPEMWNGDPFYSKKLVTDILDKGFRPACRFEEKRLSKKAEVIRVEVGMKEEWHNDSLYMGIEFAGDRCAWETGKPGGGDYYIQGCSYAVNVDNSRYEKNLLLRSLDKENGGLWKVPFEGCYRPDLEENLPFINHPELCGVSVWIAEDALPAGRYMIGHFWEDTCSRQKLYKFVPEILTVHKRTEERCGV